MKYTRISLLLVNILSIASCVTKKDVIFVIDRSASISNRDLQIGLEFIYNVTSWLTIGTGAIDVAIVSFASSSTTNINLGTYTTQGTLLQAIKDLTLYTGGGTNTESALSHVRTSVLPSGRPNVDKAVVVLTDGLSYSMSSTITEATSLKAVSNVSLFSVGIGSALLTNNDEIRQMASDPETYYVHFVYSFVYICNLVPSIVPKLDPESAALKSDGCPAIPTDLPDGWFPWTTPPTTAPTTTTTSTTAVRLSEDKTPEIVAGVISGCVGFFLVLLAFYLIWSRYLVQRCDKSEYPTTRNGVGEMKTVFNSSQLFHEDFHI